MRLLFVVSRYDADAPDPAERQCGEFAARLAPRGHQVEVATSCARRSDDYADDAEPGATSDAGVVVHRFPVRAPRDDRFFGALHRRVLAAPGPVAHVVEREWLRMHGPDLPELPSWLRSRTSDFDVVVCFSYLSATSFDGLHAVTGVVPTVLHPLADDEPELRLGVLDEMFHAAGAFACNTEEEQQLIARRFGPTGMSAVIGTGIATDGIGGLDDGGGEPDVRRFRTRFDLGDAPFLLAVGPLASGNGSTELTEMFAARAARSGDDVALVVLGAPATGPARVSGVIGTGPVDDATKDAAIAGCLALVQPSYHENLSTVLLETWARRRPALVQGRCDVLLGQARRSGGAIPYAGFAEFEAAVDLLLSSPALATSLGQAGRRYVESRYRWDDVLTRYEWFLEDAIAHWRPPSVARRLPIG